MKLIFLIIAVLCFSESYSQQAYNVIKKYNWNGSNVAVNNSGDKYNEVWGGTINGIDYGVIGSTMGTHIFDVTDVNNCNELFFVPGKESGAIVSHRDYHDYKGYLYAVCDEGNSSLQIFNLNYLPHSLPVVYDTNSLVKNAHNIFIDSTTAKLYVCGGENKFSVYSLSNPERPTLLVNCSLDFSWWGTAIAPSRNGAVHDVFVKNDTAYCHTYDGMYIIDFTNPLQPVVLSSYTSYPDKGLNHSGWLKEGTDIYFTTDETQGKKIKILDVYNPQDIEFIDTIGSNVHSQSIAHNPIVMGDYLYVSYYHDGLRIFNIKNPANPYQVAFYGTSTNTEYSRYKGAWGVYPFLGQNKILVSDMQNGFFVLDASNLEQNNTEENLVVYPNPFDDYVVISQLPKGYKEFEISLITLNGVEVYSVNEQSNFMRRIKLNLPTDLPQGLYFLMINSSDYSSLHKLIKN